MDVCGRCGLHHTWRSWCSARTAQCFKCRGLGHLARVCRAAVTGVSASLQRSLKKKRDTERMTAFLRKKDSQNLPFHDLDRNDVQLLSFNSILRLGNACNKKCVAEKEAYHSSVQGLETALQFLRTENQDLKVSDSVQKETIEQMKRENDRLQGILSYKDKAITKLQQYNQHNCVKKSELNLLREKLSAKEKDHIFLTDLRRENESSLIQQLTSLQEELNASKHELQLRDHDRNTLTETARTVKTYTLWLQETRTDMEQLSTYITDQLGPTPTGRHFLSSCSRCGSSSHHSAHLCPARLTNAQCIICQRKGHFTVFCREILVD